MAKAKTQNACYTKKGFAENKKDKAENHYIPKDWWR